MRIFKLWKQSSSAAAQIGQARQCLHAKDRQDRLGISSWQGLIMHANIGHKSVLFKFCCIQAGRIKSHFLCTAECDTPVRSMVQKMMLTLQPAI